MPPPTRPSVRRKSSRRSSTEAKRVTKRPRVSSTNNRTLESCGVKSKMAAKVNSMLKDDDDQGSISDPDVSDFDEDPDLENTTKPTSYGTDDDGPSTPTRNSERERKTKRVRSPVVEPRKSNRTSAPRSKTKKREHESGRQNDSGSKSESESESESEQTSLSARMRASVSKNRDSGKSSAVKKRTSPAIGRETSLSFPKRKSKDATADALELVNRLDAEDAKGSRRRKGDSTSCLLTRRRTRGVDRKMLSEAEKTLLELDRALVDSRSSSSSDDDEEHSNDPLSSFHSSQQARTRTGVSPMRLSAPEGKTGTITSPLTSSGDVVSSAPPVGRRLKRRRPNGTAVARKLVSSPKRTKNDDNSEFESRLRAISELGDSSQLTSTPPSSTLSGEKKQVRKGKQRSRARSKPRATPTPKAGKKQTTLNKWFEESTINGALDGAIMKVEQALRGGSFRDLPLYQTSPERKKAFHAREVFDTHGTLDPTQFKQIEKTIENKLNIRLVLNEENKYYVVFSEVLVELYKTLHGVDRDEAVSTLRDESNYKMEKHDERNFQSKVKQHSVARQSGSTVAALCASDSEIESD